MQKWKKKTGDKQCTCDFSLLSRHRLFCKTRKRKRKLFAPHTISLCHIKYTIWHFCLHKPIFSEGRMPLSTATKISYFDPIRKKFIWRKFSLFGMLVGYWVEYFATSILWYCCGTRILNVTVSGKHSQIAIPSEKAATNSNSDSAVWNSPHLKIDWRINPELPTRISFDIELLVKLRLNPSSNMI